MKSQSATVQNVLEGLSAERRALLALRLKQKNGGDDAASRVEQDRSAPDAVNRTRTAGDARVIGRAPRTEHAPLSFSQQRLWFLDQLEPGKAAYNLPAAYTVNGPLRLDALEWCINQVTARHEILRTSFASIDGKPVQVVAAPSPMVLPLVDLSHLANEQKQAEASRLIDEEVNRPFDLATGPLFRISLLRISDQEHVMMMDMHHIISDAWSTTVLISEAAVLYEAFLTGRRSPLPTLDVQYRDFAHWQREWLRGEVLENHMSYWRERLGGALPVLELPADRQRPAIQTYRGSGESRVFEKKTSEAFKALCRREGVTLFMGTLAAFYALLQRYTGQQDIIVGTPIANRNRREVEGLIGFFVNTLVLRSNLTGDPDVHEIFTRVREVALGAYAHQDVPFEMLVEALQPERNLSVQPLFQVMFSFQNAAMPNLNSGELKWDRLLGELTTSKFDLTLTMAEDGDGLVASFEYSTDLFDRWRIEQMLENLEQLIAGMAANPNARLSELPLLTRDQAARVLVEWNDTRSEIRNEPVVHRMFEEQAERSPNDVAVVFEGESLTYRELNESANRLANHLLQLGVRPDMLVGICTERGIDMVIAVLGVFKAGAAYVPLDPNYPAARLTYMLEDAHAPVLITQSHLAGSLPQFEGTVLCIDSDFGEIQRNSASNPGVEVSGDNLAYAIYTSGSTGRPKGIGLPHCALANLIDWHETAMLGGARTLQFASLSFDASFHEMFAAWRTGGTVFVISEAMRRDVEALAAYLRDAAIEKIILPVVVLQQLAERAIARDEIWESIREITTTGEQLQVTTPIKQLFARMPGCPLFNHYGPSESHVVTSYTMTSEPGDWVMHPPIGKPIWNTQIFLLDPNMKPVPTGVPAELYIGGISLARGYLNRPDLTAEKFVPDPFSILQGGRLYRTGDLARYQPDGQIEYLGRMDHQVKIRGYRIELGEIESVLGEHPAILEVAVLAREDESGGKRLVAYLVSGSDPAPAVTELADFVKSRLPEYMTPSAFVALDHMPLTPNGKVDRRALPAPERNRLTLNGEYAAPRTLTEQLLAGIWAELLGIERAGIKDNFFALGGHSLLATQVVSRIRRVFEIDVPVREIFEGPTIHSLAQKIDQARASGSSAAMPVIKRVPRDGGVPLSFAQHRLWFIDQLVPGTAFYNIPTAVRLTGALDRQALDRSLSELVKRHESLRTRFVVKSGAPVQMISEPEAFEIPFADLSEFPEPQREARAAALAEEEAGQPFDLSRGPLWRARLVRLSEHEHVALLTMHHIITDGWSISIFIREMTALYEAFREGRPSPLAELPIQYADYAAFQREWLQGDALDTQLSYWREKLGGELPELRLPFDKQRPEVKGYRGASYRMTISAELAESLKVINQREQVTLYMTLLAIYKVMLHCYSGQEDIVVGSPIANRRRAEIEGLIGFFVNPIAIRTDLSGDPTFQELLSRVRRETLDAYSHQDVPFEKIVEELQPERTLKHTPLFQVEFTLQNVPMESLELPELKLSPAENSPAGDDSATAQYDLMFDVAETPSGLTCVFRYDIDLFHRETIVQMAEHYERLLRAVVADPSLRLSSLMNRFREAAEGYQAAKEARFKDSISEKLKAARRRPAAARPVEGPNF